MNTGLGGFLRTGSVHVSDAALAKARQFGEAIAATKSGKWIVVFSWYKSGSTTNPKEGTTVQLGPGIVIGASPVSDIPAEAICETDGFRYAIQIPDSVVAAAEKKLIDVNPEPPPSVLLL